MSFQSIGRNMAVTHPISIKVTGKEPLDPENVQELLDGFITKADEETAQELNFMALNEGTAPTATNNNAAKLSQLKRLQRELRGLPPLLDAPTFGEKPRKAGPQGATQTPKAEVEVKLNKKIRFDDEPVTVEPEINTVMDPEEQLEQEGEEMKEVKAEEDGTDHNSHSEPEEPEQERKRRKKEKKDKKEKKEKKDKKGKKEKKDKKDKKEKKEKKEKK